MAVKKKKKNDHIPSSVQENNLQQQWKNGRIVVVEEQDEESKKNVTRLRRRNYIDELCNRGIITKEQKNCADRYAILCEIAGGATGDLYATINLLRGGDRNWWEPTQSQYDAYDRLFEIWKEVGKYHTSILNMIALADMNASQLEKFTGNNRHINIGHIMSAMVLLEEAMKIID